MKKIISLILTTFMVLSTVGCGEKQNITNNNSDSDYSKQANTFITENGKEKLYEIAYADNFSDGYAWININETKNKNNEQRACIDKSGKIQFFLDDIVDSCANIQVSDFKDGFCVINVEYKDEKDKDIIINTKGEIVMSSTDGIFDKVLCFGNGYFAVEKYVNDFHTAEYKVFIIDHNGNQIGDYCLSSQDSKSTSVYYRGEGVFEFKNSLNSNHFSLFFTKNNKILNFDNISFYTDFKNGKCVIEKDNEYNFLYTNGNIEKIKLDVPKEAKLFLDYQLLTENGTCYYIKNGKKVDYYFYDISTGKSNKIYSCGEGLQIDPYSLKFENGYSVLKILGAEAKYFTVIDKKGNFQFEPIECDYVLPITSNRVIASTPLDEYIIFDETGKKIYYSDVNTISDTFYDDFAVIKKVIEIGERKYTSIDYNYVDKNGKLLFENNKISYTEE